MPDPVLCPQLNELAPAVRHGFFTRKGGASTGIYSSLNVGPSSNDEAQNVVANRRSIVAHLEMENLDITTPWQHHSADVVVANSEWGSERPKADAVVTTVPNLTIGIVTADCGPVLFADPQAGIIGAAHAGWRGATGGVLQATINQMVELGSERNNIIATLGPTISADNYEVGPEFVDNLQALASDNDKYLSPSSNENHAMFDLPGYTVDRLNAAGVEARWTGHCTYALEELFFSYRRMTHRGEADYGRQISAIALSA